MALEKKILTKKGVETNYHRVGRIAIKDLYTDPDMFSIIVDIESYKNKDFREQSLSHAIEMNRINFEAKKETLEKENVYSIIYDCLKETDHFNGATDI